MAEMGKISKLLWNNGETSKNNVGVHPHGKFPAD